jgi:hypothetical protein
MPVAVSKLAEFWLVEPKLDSCWTKKMMFQVWMDGKTEF